MRLKERVMELLRQGNVEDLEEMVAENPAAIRFLQGRLWDPDPDIRCRAAVALGAAAAAHPDLGRELLRRALWTLNDESAMNGEYMLPAIGEIGRRAPDLTEPFVGPMTAYLWDEGLRPGILQALCRIADVAPELIDGIRDRLVAIEETDDTGEQECLEFLLSVNREGVDGE
jgi:HEAT repeat protein